jgi:hypothetical protein
MDNLEKIASLIADIDLSPEKLLQQFISNNNDIYFEAFRLFCSDKNIIIENYEFLDLLDANPDYLFQEYSGPKGRYWVPIIVEGYVSNILPGDWDDFGDDQLEGITGPAFGDGSQLQPLDLQLSDESDESDKLEPEENPDLPDFDEILRHRPSRSTRELESREPEPQIVEQDNGPFIARLYGLVDSWQNGAIDQPTFENQLGQLASEPTLKNEYRNIHAMVQKILTARSQ